MADLKVAFPNPCSEPWEGMNPRGCNRHCAACDRIIHDLSALTLDEAEGLLESGGDVCVRARVARSGVVELADTTHGGRRMIAAVGASMAMATAACQSVPAEERLNAFEISGTLPMVQRGKPVVRSSDGQTWHVDMEYRSRVFRVPDLYPGVYSITYAAACGEALAVMEDIVIRDRSIDLGLLEGDGDCIIVGVIVPADEDRAG
jgi:hypothetical protein